jgi:hypothetical protein
LRTILTIIVGMLALSVQAQEIYTGAIAISPSQRTNSWRPTNTLAPGDSAKLSITVAQSGTDNGRNYTLHGHPIQHPPISSPPGSIIWRGTYSSLHACNAGNSPGTTTATVTAEWVETGSGGGGSGGSPSIIYGKATGIAQADIPVFSWSFDRRMQFADGTSPITYTVTGSITGRRVSMTSYTIKAHVPEWTVTPDPLSSTNIRTGKITSTNSAKSKMGVYYGERELARSDDEIAFAKVDLIVPPGPGNNGGTPLPEDRQPAGGTAPATNELNPGTFVLLLPQDQTNRVATTLTLKADPTGGSVTLDQHGLTDLKIYTDEVLQDELTMPKTWTNGETSPTTLYMVGSSSSTNLQSAQGTLDLTYKANLAASGAEYSVKDTVGVNLLPIEVEVIHTEKMRDDNGVELYTTVSPGIDTLLRDEIANLRIKIPPFGTADWDLKIDLEPTDMKTQTLGRRGSVQMYDFGKVEYGNVTPLTTEANGSTKAGPYDINLLASKGGEETFRIAVNKEGKFKIRIKTADNKIDVTSQEFTVTKRIRKYGKDTATATYDFNKHDKHFENAAASWGAFYQHPVDDVERLKAIGMTECELGRNPTAPIERPNDIMSVGNPDDNVLDTLRYVSGHREREVDPANNAVRWLNYPDANCTSSRDAIFWGTCWLYHKAQSILNNANPPPELIPGGWKSWDYATQAYNGVGAGAGDPYYFERFKRTWSEGRHPDDNVTIWPLLTNGRARK